MKPMKSHDSDNPLTIIIHGESGLGKTHLARAICEKIQKDSVHILEQLNSVHRQVKNTSFNRSKISINERSNSNYFKDSSLPIFASTLNAESRMKFLGAWRPILRNMLEKSRKLSGISKV